MQIGRALTPDGRIRTVLLDGHSVFALPEDLTFDALLHLPVAGLRQALERAGREPMPQSRLLKPIQGQEVWAAGVTYQRSRDARIEESITPDPYDRVYVAARPELFFKATPGRVRGPGEAIAVRADSSWDVPEPELAVICNAGLEVVGYTIGNDVSSRSLEGENPLYLPQAKIYDGSCALGPAITPAWDYDPRDRAITLEILRDGTILFASQISTRAMRREIAELLSYLGRHNRFADGVVLLTGTGIVPPESFTLRPGDEVVIRIDGLGELRNAVESLAVDHGKVATLPAEKTV